MKLNSKYFIFCSIFLSITLSAQTQPAANRVDLSDIVIDGKRDDAARKLIEQVIEKQKENSPKRLEEYSFKSYTKFLATTDYDDIPDFKPQNKEDSAILENYRENQRMHGGLVEKGTLYAYNQSQGEKIITDAARISGVRTPLLEIAAIDPLPYAFDEDEFSFFYFRSFINPLSRKGLQHYNYQIQDTLTINQRETIEVSFKNIESQEKPLYGNVYIDMEDKALAEFYAEYKEETEDYKQGGVQVVIGNAGDKKYYLTSKYKKMYGAWFPASQEYFRVYKTRYHIDSTQQKRKEYFKTSTISALVDYKEHKQSAALDNKDFNGYRNEISKEAFTQFDQRIPAYRTEPLTAKEKETYVTLDSIGKEENVNTIIKYGRFFVNGFNIPLGNIDFYLPSVYSYNAYEGVRIGAKVQTNRNFHDRIGLEGAAYYGFDDKDFKYMLGANYVVEQKKNSLVGVRYTNDVMPFARPVSPLRTGVNALRESFINGENGNYIKNQQLEVYGKTTFIENLDFLTSVAFNKEESLVPYAFDGNAPDKTYKQIGVDFFFRYSPNNEYIAMPYGRIPMKTGSPNFYLTGDFNTPTKSGEGYQDLRLQLSIEHAFSWFNKTGHLLLRGGKVFGEAPLWRTFNQGLRGDGSWLKPWGLGSSNNFDTMPAMKFYSEHYIMAQWRQEWFKITKSTPVYTVVRGIYGDFDNKNLHSQLPFDSLEKGYFEGGVEVRRILLNAIGLGAYYRFGAYNTDTLKDNFAVKCTFDLPFGNIDF